MARSLKQCLRARRIKKLRKERRKLFLSYLRKGTQSVISDSYADEGTFVWIPQTGKLDYYNYWASDSAYNMTKEDLKSDCAWYVVDTRLKYYHRGMTDEEIDLQLTKFHNRAIVHGKLNFKKKEQDEIRTERIV